MGRRGDRMTRAALDLSMFDDDALEAASSKGLVRRAKRDIEAGLVAIERHGDGEAVVTADGASVTLTRDALKGARCSCSARALCRHVLAAVLVLRQAAAAPPGSPASDAATPLPSGEGEPHPNTDALTEILGLSEAALRKAFGKATLRAAAERLREGAPQIARDAAAIVVTFAGGPPVRYLPGLGPAGMVSKAKGAAAKVLHAAAVLAIREAHGIAAAEPDPPLDNATTGVDGAFLDAVRDVLAEATRSALSSASEVVEERLFDLAISSRADALPNLSARLRRLAKDVRAKREHNPAFDGAQTLAALARAFALTEALRAAATDPILRGQVREDYAPLPAELRLIGCGVEVWRSPAGARGATAHFRAAGAPSWYSVSLARAAGQDPSFDPSIAARREAVWGSPLTALADAEVVLDHAQGSPSGRLSLAREVRATVAKRPLARADVERWPDAFADWNDLHRTLLARFSPELRAEGKSSPPVALLPGSFGPPLLDEMSQRLVVPARDRNGMLLALSVPAAHERRAGALETVLRDRPWLVLATASIAEDSFAIAPFALACINGEPGVRSLDFTGPAKGGTGFLAALRERAAALRARMGGRRDSDPTYRTDDRLTARLLARVADEVLALAELGGRMIDAARLERLDVVARRLDDAGLAPLARLVERLARSTESLRPHHMLAVMHAVATLQALSRSLPLLVARERLWI